MSDPGEPKDRLQASHDIRARFERIALPGLLVVLGAYCAVALAGVVWPPPAPHAADWGAAMVAKVVSLKDTLLDVCGSLASVLGITMTRGHMDARIEK